MVNETNHEAMHTLAEFGHNRYSQNGEDGIIEKIFDLIGTTSQVCIEFGAWDGYHLSNTANLWTKGWKGILIEGHRRRYKQLVRNVSDYNCICVNAYVGCDRPTGLEAILARTGVEEEIDLLSIDIDGDDYYVLRSLERLRPRVIICEYNPTIPAAIELYAEFGSKFGASAKALCRLAENMGYTLIAITETNCFFVLRQYQDSFAKFETRLEKIKSDRHLIHLVTDYRGDYVLCGIPPYGLGVPYSDHLFGDVIRVHSRGHLFALGYRCIRWFKRLVGDYLS